MDDGQWTPYKLTIVDSIGSDASRTILPVQRTEEIINLNIEINLIVVWLCAPL